MAAMTQMFCLVIMLWATTVFAVWVRHRVKAELGKFWPSNREPEKTSSKESPRRPVLRGFLEPILVYPLYWISLLTFNNAFRQNPKLHAVIVELYVVSMTAAAYSCMSVRWGPGVWILALWRISCILMHVLSVGIFRNSIRKMRGDAPPQSTPRIVLLAFINWLELIALYAILDQALVPKRRWLYDSFTTQTTLNHASVLPARAPVFARMVEKALVASQISMSILILTTLVGTYIGIVAANMGDGEKSASVGKP